MRKLEKPEKEERRQRSYEKWNEKKASQKTQSFQEDKSFNRWDRRQKRKGNDDYFGEEEREAENSHLKDIKGRVQSNIRGILKVILMLILILFQIFIVVAIQFVIQQNTTYVYFIMELVALFAIIVLVNKDQSPSYRIAWISLVALMPISGFLFYFLWGRKSRKRKLLDRHIRHKIQYGKQFLHDDDKASEDLIRDFPAQHKIVKQLRHEEFQVTEGNKVTYYPMGEIALNAVIDEILKAEKFIFIDFFIVAEGAVWDKMYAALKKKLREGVEVRFMYDDLGGAMRTRKYFNRILEKDGIQVRVFNPILKYTGELYTNFRSHQKIVVVDGKVAFTGGFNIADEYANLVDRFGVWKDTGVRVEGPGVWGMTVTFLDMWEACANGKGQADYLSYKYEYPDSPGNTYCIDVSDGPAMNPDNSIERAYMQMIIDADRYLYVMTPYLILDDQVKFLLVDAVNRGVDVRIITPFIPDKKVVYMVTNYNYGFLLENGVRIYEYTPGFIHAKAILNEESVITGTINMDYRSFYLHYENGVWMTGGNIISDVHRDFETTLKVCHEVQYEDWKKRRLMWRIFQPFLNLFSTLM